MNNPKTLLQMNGINKSFPGMKALDQVNFDLQAGEVHILVGENGAGKSTLMKVLSGAYQPDAGTLIIDGQTVKIKNPRAAQDLGVSIIYQEFNLIPHLSVAANIFLGQEPSIWKGFVDQKTLDEKTAEILSDLGLNILPKTPVIILSVAEQQMVEVARALIYNAKILIMDEPTSALTSTEIHILFSTIRKIKNKGVGIIYISHRMEELFEIGDRVTVLRDGQGLGTFAISDVNKTELIRLMANRELKEFYPRVRGEAGDKVLEVVNLSRGKDLSDINFYLRRGEILGFSGLLGAGRSELARAIFGVDLVDSGDIRINNEKKSINSPRQAIRAGIGFLTEDRKQLGLVLQLSVKDNIGLPNLDIFSKIGLIKKNDEKKTTQRLIGDLRIKTPSINQQTLFLSGGNQQKVVMAKWLARHLDVLIFDEPTRGIDVASKVEIYQLMNELTARGVGIIMISSELPEILGMSDRILVMHGGRINGEFDATKVTQQDLLARALGEVA